MSLITPELREKARAAQRGLELVGRYAGGFAAACGMSVTVYPHLAGLAGASTFISVLAYQAADTQRNIANDPPRSDFRTRTFMSSTRLRPEQLLESLPATDERATLMIEIGVAFARASDAEEAMLRAFERAAGAYKSGDDEAASARLAEQRRFAERSANHLSEAAEKASAAGTSLAGMREGPETTAPPSGRLDEILPNDVLAAVYRAGITIGQLRRHVVSPQVGAGARESLARALTDTSPRLADLGNAFTEWDATADARRLEREEPSKPAFYIDEVEGGFRWRLVSEDGTVIATSETFRSRADARASAQRVVELASSAQLADD